MSLYAEQVLPRVIDLVMKSETLAAYRARVAAPLHGVVLELGLAPD